MVYQYSVSVGAMDELKQNFLEGRLPFPSVWTPEGAREVFNRTHTGGTLTGIYGQLVTVEFPPTERC